MLHPVSGIWHPAPGIWYLVSGITKHTFPMSTISIEQMEFYAYHGCFKEEQIIGTRFLVDLRLETNTEVAEKSDDLADTVNYQEVYLLVKKEMEVKSKLLEHVGRRILDAVKDKFPQIRSAELIIYKMNPPLGGKMKSVSLLMHTK
ncbi:MAG: dihydroneopterin aldolase [Bacteroidota bacterium]